MLELPPCDDNHQPDIDDDDDDDDDDSDDDLSVCCMCLFLFVDVGLNCFKFIAPGLNVSLQFVPPSLS